MESEIPQQKAINRNHIQEIIGYQFKDPSLLDLAMTHSSAVTDRRDSNERLEFLGDSVLGLITCERIFTHFPKMLEGDMTKIKSAAVSRRTCSKLTRSLKLHTFIELGKGMQGQARLPQSLAAAVLESIVGAIYLDGGYEAAQAFLLPLLDPIIKAAAQSGHQNNFKSVLQQYAQQRYEKPPTYRTLDEQGPDHAKRFQVRVEIDEQQFPAVWGRSKKQAEQDAAFAALETLGLIITLDNGTIAINHANERTTRTDQPAKAVDTEAADHRA